MTKVLPLFPARVPIGTAVVNGTNVPVLASPEFWRSLQQLLERVGGIVGPSTTDLATSDDEDSGTEEFRAETVKALDALFGAPPPVFDPFTDPLHPLVQEHQAYEDPMPPIAQEHVAIEALQTELTGLREEVAQLRTLINDLQQGTAP